MYSVCNLQMCLEVFSNLNPKMPHDKNIKYIWEDCFFKSNFCVFLLIEQNSSIISISDVIYSLIIGSFFHRQFRCQKRTIYQMWPLIERIKIIHSRYNMINWQVWHDLSFIMRASLFKFNPHLPFSI